MVNAYKYVLIKIKIKIEKNASFSQNYMFDTLPSEPLSFKF